MMADASDQLVQWDRHADGVLVLTLNRPGRRNAWNDDMESAYFGALDRAAADPDVRVVVLTGADGDFCPGMDMSRLARATSGDPSYVRAPRLAQTHALGFPKPLVAAIDGACAGIGFVQALMCDLRFCTPNVKFTTAFVRRGLSVEDGVSWLLPRLVGRSVAADLLLSARVVRGEEAMRMGLVNRCVEPGELLPAALAWATDVAANCAPWALAQTKAQLLADLHRELPVARYDADVRLIQARLRPDYKEGVASFLERRPPQFAGLVGTVTAIADPEGETSR